MTWEERRAQQAISQQCIAEAGGPARLDQRKIWACQKQRSDELNRSFAAKEQPSAGAKARCPGASSAYNALELEPGGLGCVTGVARDCRG